MPHSRRNCRPGFATGTPIAYHIPPEPITGTTSRAASPFPLEAPPRHFPPQVGAAGESSPKGKTMTPVPFDTRMDAPGPKLSAAQTAVLATQVAELDAAARV